MTRACHFEGDYLHERMLAAFLHANSLRRYAQKIAAKWHFVPRSPRRKDEYLIFPICLTYRLPASSWHEPWRKGQKG